MLQNQLALQVMTRIKQEVSNDIQENQVIFGRLPLIPIINIK